MKISEIKYGTRILLPCPRCERKRSLVFDGPAWYQKQKSRICQDCILDDRAEGSVLSHTRNHLKAASAEMISMDED